MAGSKEGREKKRGEFMAGSKKDAIYGRIKEEGD